MVYIYPLNEYMLSVLYIIICMLHFNILDTNWYWVIERREKILSNSTRFHLKTNWQWKKHKIIYLVMIWIFLIFSRCESQHLNKLLARFIIKTSALDFKENRDHDSIAIDKEKEK